MHEDISLSTDEAQRLIGTALDCGINMFDHADIYGGGKSEEVFAGAVKSLGVTREDLIIQSKCGIRKGYYDSSKDHIISATKAASNASARIIWIFC